MLKSLQIENYAIIRSLDISFENGFSVITGETGAGKSILLGALSLLLGNRAETGVLFDKSRKCIVEARFDVSHLNLQDYFADNNLDYQDDTIIRREIAESGKSRAFINDTPVNLSTLKNLTSYLVDIHSQHKTLMLQDSSFRLALLDQFAENKELVNIYKKDLQDWKNTEKEYLELKSKCEEAATRFDYNNFVINELENAQLSVDEQSAIEQKIKELSNAENIKSHLFNALNIISDQENLNIVQLIGDAFNEIKNLADLGADYDDFCTRIDSLKTDAQDISFEISRKCDKIEVNQELLNSLTERIDLIYNLQNKYHANNNAELLEILEKYQDENKNYDDNREQLAKLEQDLERKHKKIEDSAKKLTASRKKAIPKFVKAVEEQLHTIGMTDSIFEVQLTDNLVFGSEGKDDVDFLFSANKGVSPSDLSKTASGGELSRIMLCLKSVITNKILLPTVIFDEIDSGISGETASKVARVMKYLSDNHQVISITHLPQIAAMGKNHYFVYKENTSDTTSTKMRLLNDNEREQVIATMLSGDQNSESAMKTAREMLFNSRNNH